MKLFLASEAKHPDSVLKLKKFVGGIAGKNLAYIPTAANGENPYDQWRTESDSWKLVQTLGAQVTPIVLEEYKNASVVEVLRDKDILWFAGGACGYLMYWLRRCEVDKYLPELLTRSIYVGSSAGSMVCAPTLLMAEIFPGEEETGAGVIPGLGLVDFDIFPHFEDHHLEMIKKIYPGKKLYLVKNGEAVTVVEGQVTVLGETRVIEN